MNVSTEKLDKARANMIEQQIRPWNVLDQNVLNVLATLPRERFVSDNKQHLAFADLRLPLSHGQCMMTPKVEARLLQALAANSGDRVLEVGTGSGYVTACLAVMSQHVDSVEIHADLSATAGERLAACSIENVSLEVADALGEWLPEHRYDAIAITGSMSRYDARFEALLNPGGRLFVIDGDAPAMHARLIRKSAEGEIRSETLFETSITPLIGAERKREFVF